MPITSKHLTRRVLAVVSSIIAVTCLATGPAQAAGFWPTTLENEVTHMCADVPESGPGRLNDPVNQWYCVPGDVDNQMWEGVEYPWYSGHFAIRNIKSNLCMDVPYFGTVDPGTPVSLYTCRLGDQDNQMFWRWDYGNNRYWIVHSKTGLCLDVAPGGANARLTLWHCSTTDDHIWIVRG